MPKPWQSTPLNDTKPALIIELNTSRNSDAQAVVVAEPNRQVDTKPQTTTSLSKTMPEVSHTEPEISAAQPTVTVIQSQKAQQLKTDTQTTEPVTQQPATTGDIMLSVKNSSAFQVPKEFQARTGAAMDFHIPQNEIEDWLADIPYLDESVDRPTIEMRFYAQGFEGKIEKFFDKITISKTFTTKYGTKIHCALIGVLAACSWK